MLFVQQDLLKDLSDEPTYLNMGQVTSRTDPPENLAQLFQRKLCYNS